MDRIFPNDGTDGAHWGVSDWYDENRQYLLDALAKGPSYEWDTGWYTVKKEIHSARITCANGTITIFCYRADDFDSDGSAYREIQWTNNIDEIGEALDETMDDAEENRSENAPYAGFSIIKDDKSWVETLILPRGWGSELLVHPWGFQGECDELTDEEKELLEEYAWDYVYGLDAGKFRTVGRWTVRPWEEE